MEKILLELIGITYNQIEYGVYALVLQQAGGTRRIPIIIGHLEAQAIECKLQEIKPPRPLTHDTMLTSLSAFGISLVEVEIKKLPDGVFGANLVLKKDNLELKVDSRASDAISLALRANAPIYTSSEVMEEAGFEPSEKKIFLKKTTTAKIKTSAEQTKEPEGEYSKLSLDKLNLLMAEASENEDYEKAAAIKKEIERRLEKI